MWQIPREQYLPACVVPAVKFIGGGIRVSGCLSCSGLGLPVLLHANVNVKVYKDILTQCIVSTVEDHFSHDNCLYQNDNASCQKAGSLRESFVDNNVPEIDWPGS
jgi:hypothetical protein